MPIAQVVTDDNNLAKELCPVFNHHRICNKVKLFPYHAETIQHAKITQGIPTNCLQLGTLQHFLKSNANANGDANRKTASKSVTNCTDPKTVVLPLLWVGFNEGARSSKVLITAG